MNLAVYTGLSRAVFRFLPGVLWRTSSNEKEVHLTFDDGPFADSTPHVLAMLDRLDAKATFFLLGKNAETCPDMARLVAARGHTIGSHSFHHLDAWKSGGKTAREDCQRGSETLKEILGSEPRLFRPPYGHLSPAHASWIRGSALQVVLWDTPSLDFVLGTRASINAGALFEKPVRGSIIVVHERPMPVEPWLSALEKRCSLMMKDGWRFEGLADYEGREVDTGLLTTDH